MEGYLYKNKTMTLMVGLRMEGSYKSQGPVCRPKHHD